jgi:hypothetical protein
MDGCVYNQTTNLCPIRKTRSVYRVIDIAARESKGHNGSNVYMALRPADALAGWAQSRVGWKDEKGYMDGCCYRYLPYRHSLDAEF